MPPTESDPATPHPAAEDKTHEPSTATPLVCPSLAPGGASIPSEFRGAPAPHLGHVCGTPGVDFITEHWGDAGLARLKRPKVPTLPLC